LVVSKEARSTDRVAVEGGEPSARRAGDALDKKATLDRLRLGFRPRRSIPILKSPFERGFHPR
jgi:hypothetical protein